MSIVESPSFPVGAVSDDSAAIADLAAAFAAQKKALAANRNPSIDERRERLMALIAMMMANRDRIGEALASDFGAHPKPAADLIEVLGVIGRAQYVLAHFEEWMKPSVRETEPTLHGSAQAFVEYQPKGVIGNIVPWNFPFDLSVGPLTEMLAAGNRVIIKPSEYTPACGELLREIVAEAYDPEMVHVVTGGIELAQAFAGTSWDHLLYTGSPNVGRQVMQSAARNLTPVTLELGGKCPAILTPGSVNSANVESIVGTKIIKNGQMCISVDYALVPRAEVDAFVHEARTFMEKSAPDYARGDEVTGIISPRHLARLTDMIEEARERQARIVTLEQDDAPDPASRRMPMSLVVDPPLDLRIMQEEIFGPILPVVPYDDLQAAVDAINAGERPLGLYVFGDDEALTRRVIDGTHSGGACINTCALQGALPSLGFGGSGMSGMGRHHGIEGFREFSNQRGVVVRGENDMIAAFYSPYATAAGLVQAVLEQAG